MTDIESEVARHYGDGGLLERILGGLERAGLDPDGLCSEDLAPVEEFHIGGREATANVVSALPVDAVHHVLDVGCGIGGAARYMATRTGCAVTGIDLTPEYVETARDLTQRVGLDRRVGFHVASALDLPFSAETFDTAITLHVAMNIADKSALYREIARVLRPGGRLCLFDVMRAGDGSLVFPVPWAESPNTSFLATRDEVRALLLEAGFRIEEVVDRTEFAREFFARALGGPQGERPVLGIHLIMGESSGIKMRNMLNNLDRGVIAPVQITAARNV